MEQRKDRGIEERALALIERHWKWLVVAAWIGFAAWFVISKWSNIQFFNLADTDDNMRIAQVRGLLGGQDWYDLRQYRMNPPEGANIHWSRLVDLPLAALILLLRPFVGNPEAERLAVAIAPLLPYLILLFSVAITTRRLVGARAYPLAFLALFFAGSTNGMFSPERIDHHGWQIAIFTVMIAALADPKKVRGGLLLGLASAASLAIGLELLIYIAIAGAAMVLFWVDDPEERERLRAYAVALGGGTAATFLIFASYANRAPVCDALSPVWLSDAVLGSALLYGLALLSPADWKRRLAIAAAAGVVVAAFHALSWPHCLQRLEGVSPEVERLWLDYVREARPIYSHGWRIASLVVALPITGAIGWLFLFWLKRNDREVLRRTLAAAAPGLVATALLLWQTRTGPAAQVSATIGAAALLYHGAPWVWEKTSGVVRILAVTVFVLAGAGAAIPFALNLVPAEKQDPRKLAIGKANRLCNSMWGMRPIAQQPRGMVFTFLDLGPRIISITHHNAVGGPYHRNGEQIADVMSAFRGSADEARATMIKYRADYLLTCPKSSTTTIFMSEAKDGFYAQLERGEVPPWLTRIPLPADSPFKMWKVAR